MTVTVRSPMVRLTTRPSVQVLGVLEPLELELEPELLEPEFEDDPELPDDPEPELVDRLLDEPELDEPELDEPELDEFEELELEPRLELDEPELLDWLRCAWACAAAAASASACLVAL